MNAARLGGDVKSVASWVAVAFLALSLSLAGFATAGSSMDPEIMDAEGDATPASAVVADADAAQNLSQKEGLYDLTAAWIAYETHQDFQIFVQLADIPDGWGLPLDPPEATPQLRQEQVVRLVANFRVDDVAYQAIAALDSPAEGELVSTFQLLTPDGAIELAGMVDPESDIVRLQIMKQDVAAHDASILTGFFLHSMYGSHVMDYAPDARQNDVEQPEPPSVDANVTVEPPGLPEVPTQAPEVPDEAPSVEVPSLVTVQYGRDYEFGDYERPASTSTSKPAEPQKAPAAVAEPKSKVRIEADQVDGQVVAGDVAKYTVRLTNSGDADDTVVLSLSSAPGGWAHELVEGRGEVVLISGASREVRLFVTASSDLESGNLRSVVSFASERGQTGSVAILTLLGSDDEAATTQDTDSGGSVPEAGGAGVPSPAIVPALMAVLAGAWFARRRRPA